jgi:hypothetical protein
MRFAKACSGFVALAAFGVQAVELAPFSTDGTTLHSAWTTFMFAKRETKTSYALANDAEKGGVIRAQANAAGSALMHRMEVQASAAPILRWSWKVTDMPSGSDVKTKEGDDYAARVYVAFKYEPSKASVLKRAQFGIIRALYGEYPPLAALSYIVEPSLPEGTIVSSPYTEYVKMIVVDNNKNAGQWRSFSRNVVEDYRRAFGAAPETAIAGIAIMSDADNTQSKAGAYYAKVTLSEK